MGTHEWLVRASVLARLRRTLVDVNLAVSTRVAGSVGATVVAHLDAVARGAFVARAAVEAGRRGALVAVDGGRALEGARVGCALCSIPRPDRAEKTVVARIMPLFS